jgi:RHS repeat-associated protein
MTCWARRKWLRIAARTSRGKPTISRLGQLRSTERLRRIWQYFDLESGWNHNGFRDYWPDLGRYAEPDPLAMQVSAELYDPISGRLLHDDSIGLNEGGDFYVYVGNDPVDLVDASGTMPGQPPEPYHSPVGTNCTDASPETAKKVVAGVAYGTILYWIISEGSRLFPPRNFVPVP